MEQLRAAMCTAYTQLSTLMIPAALFGIFIAVIGFLLLPALGEGVVASRGYIRLALFAVIFVGFLPDIITALAAIGGFQGGACTALVLARPLARRRRAPKRGERVVIRWRPGVRNRPGC